MKSLDEQIRQAIKDQKMTGYRLAKLSGVSQGNVARFIAGKRGINLSTASKFADALDLELQNRKKR